MMRPTFLRVLSCLLFLGGSARAQFLEPGVSVLQVFEGETPGELFGAVIADLTDIDDDGVSDVAIAATLAGAGPPAGRVDVYSGRTGERLHRLVGPVAGGQLGSSLADAGDLDRDGVHDLIAGAPRAGAGRVYVFSGADGSIVAQLDGEVAGDAFGVSVGSPGDVDGDRVPDLLVGAPGAAGRTGRVYLFSGRTRTILRRFDGEKPFDFFGSGVAGTGDLDADRRGDFIVGARGAGANGGGLAYVFSGREGTLLHPPLVPAPSAGEFGAFFVATPGDVDGDGTPDLYVGDYADGADAGGRAYVFSGRSGRELYQFPGPPAGGAGCGRGARDVDGDRRADLIVGAYTAGVGAPFGGQATVYSGCTGAPLVTFTGATPGATLGFDSVGIGDTNDDHEADFLISAAVADRVYLVAGARTCVADFDRDGRIDGRDGRAFLLALLRGDPRADTNCDGHIGLVDYLGYLRAVLVGCG